MAVPHPAWIEIDLEQFRKNIAAVRRLIGKSLFCLPVKANAYGHGLVQMAQASGADYLAAAHLSEGVALRSHGIQTPILVLGAIHEDQIEDLLVHDLEFSISSLFKAQAVAARAKGRKCRVHIEVDTGMHRTGVRPETAIRLAEAMDAMGCFTLVGIYSHFANADAPENPSTKQQIDAFQKMLQHPVFHKRPLICHLANSSGAMHFPSAHMQMVRAAFLPLGYGSNGEVAPCFSLKTKVSYFKVIPEGAGVSYGHTWRAPQQTRIVTVPVGYGDGYRRTLSNRGSVLIRGKRYPIVGNICMDQFMVNIGMDEVHVGDEVVLIGKQGQEEISAAEMAQLCDTIPYEIICQFNDRIPRIYLR